MPTTFPAFKRLRCWVAVPGAIVSGSFHWRRANCPCPNGNSTLGCRRQRKASLYEPVDARSRHYLDIDGHDGLGPRGRVSVGAPPLQGGLSDEYRMRGGLLRK